MHIDNCKGVIDVKCHAFQHVDSPFPVWLLSSLLGKDSGSAPCPQSVLSIPEYLPLSLRAAPALCSFPPTTASATVH